MGKKEKTNRKRKIRRRIRWTYIDRNFVAFLSNRRIKVFTSFMKFMTHLGDGLAWFVLCVIFLAFDFYAGIALTFASLIQILLQVIIKHIFNRKRPYEQHNEISNVLSPPDRYSFPSGHTAGAFAIVFVFFYLYTIFFVPMLIIASLIAFSRVYLGLHYPTDVLAGVILGLISALLGINLALWIQVAIRII